MTLIIDKMDRRGHINTADHERLPKKTKATKGLPERLSVSFIKVTGQMHNTIFKRKLTFSFTVIILA